MLTEGFESSGWIAVTNRAGNEGQWFITSVKDDMSLGNITQDGRHYKCSEDVFSVEWPHDSPGGFDTCKNYKCFNNPDFEKICSSFEETPGYDWSNTLPEMLKYDEEAKVIKQGIYRSASQMGSGRDFKLGDKYSMHKGGFACPKDSGCSTLLLGSTSGHFNFEIMSSISLMYGSVLTIGAIALI